MNGEAATPSLPRIWPLPGGQPNMRVVHDWLFVLVAACALLVAAALAAPAQTFEESLARFAADNFSETEAAISVVATSGHAMAAAVIQALQEGRLQADPASRKAFIKEANGRLLDAATGQPVIGEAPANLKAVRVNNRLRRAVEAALGGLTLLSPEPGRRWEAAQAVLRSKDSNALPALETAIGKETDPALKRFLTEARAAVLLYGAETSDAQKLEAIGIIRARGDQEALALLGGIPSNTSPEVARAARDGISAIQNQLAIWDAAQNAWYGLSLGSVLLLAAIGLAITFGVMGVINMAHGEMVMLGAYVTFVVQEVIRSYNPGLFDYSLLLAVPLAFLVSGLIGILIEQGVIRFLYARPLETLLATWGISLILQQAVRTAFGPTNREVGNPSWMSGAFDLGHLTITYNRMWIIVFTLAVFVALLGLLRYTRLGLEMRAVTQNRPMAASMGIRTARIDALTFGLG